MDILKVLVEALFRSRKPENNIKRSVWKKNSRTGARYRVHYGFGIQPKAGK